MLHRAVVTADPIPLKKFNPVSLNFLNDNMIVTHYRNSFVVKITVLNFKQ